MKKENEAIRIQKKGLDSDLKQLLERRHDIEQLQTTLVQILRQNTSKKIDVEELKFKLADSLRTNRFKAETSLGVKEQVRKGSKSKSLGKKENYNSNEFSGSYLDDRPEKLTASYKSPDDEPAWAKTLKRGIK